MNKLCKIILGLAAIFVISCSYYDTNLTEPYDVFIVKQPGANKDGRYSVKDTVYFNDNVGIGDTIYQDNNYTIDDNVYYNFTGGRNRIWLSVLLQINENNGYVRMYCNAMREYEEVNVQLSSDVKSKNSDGYVVDYKESLDVDGVSYNHILIIDASDAKKSSCNFNRLYFARDEGLIRMDINEDISLTRQGDK